MATLAILTADETRRAEALAATRGVPGAALMDRAGKAAALVAARTFGRRPVTVLCGPGNNGGDGFVLARSLKESGWTVRLGLLGDKSALTGDAALMAGAYDGTVEPAAPGLIDGAELIVDALFGTGLSRPLEGEARALVEAMNAHRAPVLSLDLPSGVDADTGAILGGQEGAAVQAARTVAFLTKKPGHVLLPGRALAGAVEIADIGAPEEVLTEIGPRTFENQPALWGGLYRRPGYGAHKYSRGHAAVVSGGRLRSGAARLAARGALRAGAGLVTVLTPREAAAENAAHLTAIMLREAEGAGDIADILSDERFKAALIGPGAGVGEALAEAVAAILKSGAGAVLDADALTSFEGAPDALFALTRTDDVLTPHAGEFERLFKDLSVETSGKLEAARQAAARAGAVVVVKGADTVIAAPDGRAAINVNAPSELATAGSGDVLAGFITGLRAQGLPGFEAAAAGVWLHGASGLEAGIGLVAEDLPEALPRVLANLFAPPQQRQQQGAKPGGPQNGPGGRG